MGEMDANVERPFPRKSWSVQGYTNNILAPPLFDYDDIHKIVIRNCDGKPVFALLRNGERGFFECDASQPDWDNFCRTKGIS